jgi:hypothetical protein
MRPNARILHVSSTNRMPALTKNDTRPTHCSNSACVTLPRALIASSTAIAFASANASSCAGVAPAFLQVVAADVRRVPARDRVQAVLVHVRDEAHRVHRRIDVRAAREVLLDDVVLRRALEELRVDAAPLGERHVERQAATSRWR